MKPLSAPNDGPLIKWLIANISEYACAAPAIQIERKLHAFQEALHQQQPYNDRDIQIKIEDLEGAINLTNNDNNYYARIMLPGLELFEHYDINAATVVMRLSVKTIFPAALSSHLAKVRMADVVSLPIALRSIIEHLEVEEVFDLNEWTCFILKQKPTP